jgi:hypothetical protein
MLRHHVGIPDPRQVKQHVARTYRHTEYGDETSARLALADVLDPRYKWRRMDHQQH